ncbi:MAG: hypothetical protein LKE46_05325 [Clostridium sp.]|jgi:hypothetical protein|uniref:hypothetical protein n=1 Tax=Clostridium sp. TaxID=1506 RepID=UPI0025C18B53|nr:hypothetical protein [Clostridium sp.]MCH3963673.1 hypothetical protein [Clostridium sp.]MCI1714814.1 hypothetical protein [Clostridium sp.]MCI1798997.1 hypothetical protein [Clostridium sp.]MCI1812997.1 hypothetical protein [Clostridium sp.]MCI1869887.1 hypothetical protein [Clostridium sp.]
MNSIESRFLNIMRNNFSQQDEQEAFISCPKVFYNSLSDREINAMMQLYRVAYKKAKSDTKNKFDIFYNGSEF